MNLNLDYLNIRSVNNLYRNISAAELTEWAIKRGEGQLSNNGSLVINTGKYTGRSAKDRFIVVDDITRDTVTGGKQT